MKRPTNYSKHTYKHYFAPYHVEGIDCMNQPSQKKILRVLHELYRNCIRRLIDPREIEPHVASLRATLEILNDCKVINKDTYDTHRKILYNDPEDTTDIE